MRMPMLTCCELKTDVLVVGGGPAGFWSALSAKKHVDDVLIVDKGPLDWGGVGFLSAGDFFALDPGTDLNDLLKELVFYYDGLCDQNMVAGILRASRERFLDYEAMGHEFVRTADGSYMRMPQRGLELYRLFQSKPYGKGGVTFTRELLAMLDKEGIRRLGHIMVTDIVSSPNGECCGAAGFFTKSGRPVRINAKAVVLSTNNGSWKCSYHANTIANGVVEMALDAGVTLRNFEFFHVWNIPLQFTWEGQTGLLPKGGKFLNALGEDFMKRYSPRYGAKGDPHYNVRGMAHECLEGRGPIYFDPNGMSEEDKEIMRPKAGWMKLNDDKLKALGIDFFHQKTVWIPQIVHSYGGMETGPGYATGMPGLYGAGRSVSIDPGVYLGGWSLCVCAVTGHDAGHAAGTYAEGHSGAGFDASAADALIAKRLGLLGREGMPPKDIVRELQEIMSPVDVCILKTGTALGAALERLREVKETMLPRMAAPDPQQLCKCVEAQGITDLTEVSLLSALTRDESRAGHYREDFPDRDEAGPYWVCVTRRNGIMRAEKKRVPLEQYPVQPSQYYMDEFHFPRPKQAKA